jgi:hypothetical protein
MTPDVSLELLGRMRRVVELTQQLHAMRSWNEDARQLSNFINHEIAVAQEQLRLHKTPVRKQPLTAEL